MVDHTSPTVIQAGSLLVNGGNLTWDGAPANSNINTNHVLFVLKKSGDADGKKSVVVCLKEPSAEGGESHALVLLECDAIPDELHDKQLKQLPDHLREGRDRQVDFIVSTHSGTGFALDFWQQVLQPLWKLVQDELGEHSASAAVVPDGETQEHVLITQSAESVSQFARGLSPTSNSSPHPALKPRTVILLSGDGGVSDLLNGLQAVPDGPLPAIALLPLGTGNALFHSLHKPLYSETGPSAMNVGLRTLFQGSPANLPVFRASFSPNAHIVAPGSIQSAGSTVHTRAISHLDGAVVASYGFHASLIYESDTPAYRVHGDKRFGMVAQELLRESKPYTARVEVRRPGSSAWEAIPREHHAYVLTTLVSNLERTFTISPASRPLDGQLRTIHFGNIGGARAMEAMTKAYDGGKHVDVSWDDGEKIYYDAVDEINITIEEEEARWRMVCIDGTIVEVPKGGQMSVATLDQSLCQIVVSPSVVSR